MSREQLLDIVTRYVHFINTSKPEASVLSTIAAENVVVPIPYPGSTPDFQGLMSTTTKVHAASPDFKMSLLDSIVDEKESKVVLLLNASGTHEG
jgi:hypothetical protein